MDLISKTPHLFGQTFVVRGNVYEVGATGLVTGVLDEDAEVLLQNRTGWQKVGPAASPAAGPAASAPRDVAPRAPAGIFTPPAPSPAPAVTEAVASTAAVDAGASTSEPTKEERATPRARRERKA